MRGKNILDDPEWRRLRNRLNGNPAQKILQSNAMPLDRSKLVPKKKNSVIKSDAHKNSQATAVSVQFSIPKIPKIIIPETHRRYAKIGILSGAILLGCLGLYKTTFDKKNSHTAEDVLSKSTSEPEFDTVLPEGKLEETTSGDIKYDSQRKVASFTDVIGGVNVTVSQQPIPEQFKNSPDENVKKIAEEFSATTVINESNPKAYLGTDVSGAQSVIFHKNDVLVFIFSARSLDKDEWAQYITKLL